MIFRVEFDMFVNDASATEVGTSHASMNRTVKTNAAKGVQNNYNEYKEFHRREVEGHVCAAFMDSNGMTSMDGNDNISIAETQCIQICQLCIFPIHYPNYMYIMYYDC